MYLSPIFIFLGPWVLGSLATYFYSDYSVIFNNLSTTGTWYLALVALFLFYSLIIFNIHRKRKVDLEKLFLEKINLNSLTRIVKIFFILHLIITILAIIYSSGFPLYWVIVGDPRTQVQ